MNRAAKLIDDLVFDVASYRGLTDAYIHAQPGSWLLDQFERVLRARWGEAMGVVTATEVALSRVLTLALSKKKQTLKPLPSFDEVMGRKEKERRALEDRPGPSTSWIEKFERVNRIGRFRDIVDDDAEET